MDHNSVMKRALQLAARARGKASPNPMVGSVLIKKGRVVAEDYHKKAGTPHAEALVLKKAGAKAKGGTLYITLEPCCHTNKRTPPCANAIIESGVAHVVIAMRDPNPYVSGKGVQMLRQVGIMVTEGVCEDEARALNEAYIKHITTGVPFVTLKAAMTLDGKIATPKGESKWITGESARKLVHLTRSRVDAIVTAIGTVLADDPSLTARASGGRSPLRVVIDPEFKTPRTAKLMTTPPGTVIVSHKADAGALPEGVEALIYSGKLKLEWLMRELGKRGVTSVLIEGGSSLNGHALVEGVVDKVMFFVAPKIIAGRESFPVVGGREFMPLGSAIEIEGMKARRVGADWLFEGRVRRVTR